MCSAPCTVDGGSKSVSEHRPKKKREEGGGEVPFSTSPATTSFLFSPFPLSDADASLSSPLPLSRLLLLPTAGALFPFCQRVSSVQENRKERSSRQREQWEGSFLLKKVCMVRATCTTVRTGGTLSDLGGLYPSTSLD